MAILTTIAGIPLFSTLQEALSWAADNGLTGYHTHTYQGTQGYMGGENHSQATGMATNPNVDTSGGSGGGGYSGGGSGGMGGGY